MSSGSSVPACRFYSTPGGCWYGDRCRFAHVGIGYQSTESRPFCSYFMSGSCRFGSSCFNRHAPSEYQLKTQDLSDLDTSLSNPSTSESDQSMSSMATSSSEATQSTSTSDLNQSDVADVSRSSEECVKPRHKPHDITCGQCGAHYEGVSAYDKLKEHYLDNLSKMDGKHTAFLSKGKFRKFSVCDECDRHFNSAHAFLQHIVAKAKVTSTTKEHANDLDCVAQMFVDRDAGNDTQKDFISFLCDYLTAEGADSTEEELDLEDEDMKYLGDKSWEDDEHSDDEPFEGYNEDVNTILSLGFKPWDLDAWDVLYQFKQDREETEDSDDEYKHDQAETEHLDDQLKHDQTKTKYSDEQYKHDQSETEHSDDEPFEGYNEDVNTILSLGFKPWDLDAWDVLYQFKQDREETEDSDDEYKHDQVDTEHLDDQLKHDQTKTKYSDEQYKHDQSETEHSDDEPFEGYNEDVNTILSLGFKPWDLDAWDVLYQFKQDRVETEDSDDQAETN